MPYRCLLYRPATYGYPSLRAPRPRPGAGGGAHAGTWQPAITSRVQAVALAAHHSLKSTATAHAVLILLQMGVRGVLNHAASPLGRLLRQLGPTLPRRHLPLLARLRRTRGTCRRTTATTKTTISTWGVDVAACTSSSAADRFPARTSSAVSKSPDGTRAPCHRSRSSSLARAIFEAAKSICQRRWG